MSIFNTVILSNIYLLYNKWYSYCALHSKTLYEQPFIGFITWKHFCEMNYVIVYHWLFKQGLEMRLMFQDVHKI